MPSACPPLTRAACLEWAARQPLRTRRTGRAFAVAAASATEFQSGAHLLQGKREEQEDGYTILSQTLPGGYTYAGERAGHAPGVRLH
jgi:hypothetical protein